MYLYNISIIVEDDTVESLINWVQQDWFKSLPQQSKLLKMLDSPHEGQTYCIQTIFEHSSDIPKFQQDILSLLQIRIAEQHTNKAFLFDSTMKYL